jgi:lipopolysaccharide export system permease protein
MIFQRILRRELIGTAVTVFIPLFMITATVMLIKVLGQAARRQIPLQDVIVLLGLQSLNYTPILFILTGYISVLLVLTRGYQDSEMMIWFASGKSLTDWIKPVLWFSLPIIILVTCLSFLATPWGNRESERYRAHFNKRQDISRALSGKFEVPGLAKRVYFVESISNQGNEAKNIFFNAQKNGVNITMAAAHAKFRLDRNGNKFLILSNGHRYDVFSEFNKLRVIKFEDYGVLVANNSRVLGFGKTSRAISTSDLFKNQSGLNAGELLWRLSLPIMVPCLMVLAIPLSFVDLRLGRSINLLIALILFIAYVNITNIFRVLVEQGALSLGMAWWPIHLAVIITASAMFLWRLNINGHHHPLIIFSNIKNMVTTPIKNRK